MHLTRQTEIALEILVACAAAPTQSLQTRVLATQTGTTRDHTAQIAALLTRAGLLRGMRGRGGGLQIAQPPAEVTLAEVIKITQPELLTRTDPADRSACPGSIAIGTILAASQSLLNNLLARFTIADLQASPVHAFQPCLGCEAFPNHPRSWTGRAEALGRANRSDATTEWLLAD